MAGSGVGHGSLGPAPGSAGVISGLSAPAAAPSSTSTAPGASAPPPNTGIGSSADIGETGGIGDAGPSRVNDPNQNQNAAPVDQRRKTTADYLGQATRDLAQDIEK